MFKNVLRGKLSSLRLHVLMKWHMNSTIVSISMLDTNISMKESYFIMEGLLNVPLDIFSISSICNIHNLDISDKLG